MVNLYTNQSRVEMLKKRANRCCCRYCGSALEIRKIVFSDYEDARIELFCPECDRIEFGTEPEIYKSAVYFVDTIKFNCYDNLNENVQTRKMTVAKVCDIMAWENKTIGILDQDGFKIPVDVNLEVVGEVLTLNDDDLERIENAIK